MFQQFLGESLRILEKIKKKSRIDHRVPYILERGMTMINFRNVEQMARVLSGNKDKGYISVSLVGGYASDVKVELTESTNLREFLQTTNSSVKSFLF